MQAQWSPDSPSLSPPNLQLVRMNSHEPAPFSIRLSQEVQLKIGRSWRDHLCFSLQLPSGSQQGYRGIPLQVEQMIGGPWHQEVQVCVYRFTGELAGLQAGGLIVAKTAFRGILRASMARCRA